MAPLTVMPVLNVSFLIFFVFAQAAGQGSQPIKIRVNGVELHYIEQGQGEPLIFIHGASGDYRAWEPQLKLFSQEYRAISYSRRYNYPNRNTHIAKNHSALIEAADLAAFIHKLKLGRVRLVGNSYGAFTALVLALKHPEMVRSLVLAEPPVHQLIRDTPRGEAVYRDFMNSCWMPAADAFKAGDDERAMKILSDGISGPGRWDGATAERRAVSMQNSLFFKVLTASSDPFPTLSRSKLQRLSTPTLIITGENTTRIHRLVDEELLRCLPNAKAAFIPNASHASNRDNPAAYNAALSEFLRSQKN